MPRARQNKRADAQSKETTFSGLPKACKLCLTTSNQSAPESATYTTMVYDKPPRFNHGPFTFGETGAYLNSIIVQEPGVYEFHASVGFIANSQMASLWLIQNGQVTWRDGSVPEVSRGATLSNGTFVVGLQVRQIAECRAGDIINVSQIQTTSGGGPAATALSYQWFYAEKRGGQY